jgi:hypothetical protein
MNQINIDVESVHVADKAFCYIYVSTGIIFVIPTIPTGECYDSFLAICSVLINRIVDLIDGWLTLFDT